MTILNANEYITKGEIVQILHNAYAEDRIQAKDGCTSVLDDIGALKAADVQPVKRGRWLSHHAIWIDQPKIEGWFVQAKCSECEKWAHVMNPYTKSVGYECCPHCGARMIKDDDTNG